MYEEMTYETILKRLLSRINSSLDKREGSIIYDALAPAAAELTQLYMELDVVMNQTFADTASREYLIKRASERGITPYPATYAVGKGVFNMAVPLGSRFSIDTYNYSVSELLSDADHSYKMTCETSGNAPNGYTGALIPIEYIRGLTKAELTEILVPGEEEEDTEKFRQRYFDSLNSQAFGGNVTDYKQKVNALQGVGGVKVYPVWNGGGTVKLVVINSEFKAPTEELVSQVQTAIDPEQNHGEGIGLAPIGHVVTVAGVEETSVNITTTITYQEGWNWEELKPAANEMLDSYFQELSKTWADRDALIVRISQIESRFLDLEGVVDIQNTSLNGVQENLTLGADHIPKRGIVNA